MSDITLTLLITFSKLYVIFLLSKHYQWSLLNVEIICPKDELSSNSRVNYHPVEFDVQVAKHHLKLGCQFPLNNKVHIF